LNPDQLPGSVRLSPINAVHRASGATFTNFAGWHLPLRYSGDLAEHRAVRESAGLFDISHMGQIVVDGPDAASALSGALVSDVGRLAKHRASYTMICDADGGVIDDLIVYRLDQDKFLVIANAANTLAVLSCLVDRAATRAISIEDRTSERALFSIQGPNATGILARCLEDHAELPRRFGVQSSAIVGRRVLVARTGYTGEDGFEISVAVSGAEVVWSRLVAGDGENEVSPAGLAARDSLRLEAGLPLYGHELGLERTPFAAGYGRVVDLDHAFVGDAALAEVARRGSDDVLVGLVCSGRRSPRMGHAVHASDGRAIGAVTSGGPSPTLAVPIAMAYVARSHSECGSKVIIDVRGRKELAEIVSLPFYRREKRASVPTLPKTVTNEDGVGR
jgi:aminomethyltransferase